MATKASRTDWGLIMDLSQPWAHELQATLFLSAEDPNAAAHFINKLLDEIYEDTYWGQHDLKQSISLYLT